jgi:transposase-like protein
VETTVNGIMDAQADMFCEEDGTTRNGYRERKLTTCVGEIVMRIPKVRLGTFFPDSIITRYSRTDKAVICAVAEMYATGVSTRKIQKVAAKLGIEHMSRSQVSRLCETLDGEVEDLTQKDFSGMSFPYLWLDATYVKCRCDGHVVSLAIVTAIACGQDGVKRFVGLDVVDTESYPSWLAFLRRLRKRGVEDVVLITSDAHQGLRRAIEEVYSGATWQRCIVHLERNVCGMLKTRRERALAGSILQAVFRESDADSVREAYHVAIEEVGKLNTAASEFLEEAETDALAYLDFPDAHWKRIRTNNVQERTNREIKRRSRVVQVFPSQASLLRLVGAVCTELDEDWSSRCYIHPGSLALLKEDKARQTKDLPSSEAKQRARDIITLAMQTATTRRKAA